MIYLLDSNIHAFAFQPNQRIFPDRLEIRQIPVFLKITSSPVFNGKIFFKKIMHVGGIITHPFNSKWSSWTVTATNSFSIRVKEVLLLYAEASNIFT